MKAQILDGLTDVGWWKIDSSTITFENRNDVQALLEKLFSAKFGFSTNSTIDINGKFPDGLAFLEHYKKLYYTVPIQDIIVVPHAFCGSSRNRDYFELGIRDRTFDDDIPLESSGGETSVSIWIKEHPAPRLSSSNCELEQKKPIIKKLYRCPACGKTITEEEYQDDLASGGNGYCGCRFSAKDEHGNIWFPREYTEYEVFTREVN